MKRAFYFILGLCIVFGAIAQAQPPTFPGQMNNNGNDNDPAKRFRDFFTWKLINTLEMDEKQSETVLPAWYQYSRERARVYHQRRELIGKINESVDNPSIEDDVLREDAEQLRKNYEEEYKITSTFLDKARKALDDRRYAKLVVFEENMVTEVMNQNPFGNRRR